MKEAIYRKQSSDERMKITLRAPAKKNLRSKIRRPAEAI